MTRVYDFMKSRGIMLVISALVIIGGAAGTVAQGGFNLGIDFQAGPNLTVEVAGGTGVSAESVRRALAPIDSGIQVQRLGTEDAGRYVVRVRDDQRVADFETVMAGRLLSTLRDAFPGSSVRELEVSYVGPRFSRDLSRQALFLTIFALVLILVYLWFRFRLGYALSSIAALLHDVLVILGLIGTLQLEVSTATIAAVLTIIGYSLNDTIVIFDRIRENEVLLRDSSFRSTINTSVSQSLSRTLITSITTLLAVSAIFVFSTGQVQLFALTLIIGVVVGTYSSVFIASPALLAWTTWSVGRQRRKEAEKYHRGAVSSKTEVPSGDGTAAAVPPGAASADVERAKREIARQRSQKKRR